MISSNYIINSVDLELSDSKKNISKIKFGNMMVSAPETKYH